MKYKMKHDKIKLWLYLVMCGSKKKYSEQRFHLGMMCSVVLGYSTYSDSKTLFQANLL